MPILVARKRAVKQTRLRVAMNLRRTSLIGLMSLTTSLAALLSFGQSRPTALQPGRVAPDFELIDARGVKRSLADLLKQQPLILVLCFGDTQRMELQLEAVREAGRQMETVATVAAVVPQARLFDPPGSAVLLNDPDRHLAKKFGLDDESTGRWVLIDSARKIRRAGEYFGLDADQLVSIVQSWRRGKTIYEGACARCHGQDGTDTSYPNIKTLGGIGSRMSEEEIIDATEATGVVDLSSLSSADLKALAAYVAGL